MEAPLIHLAESMKDCQGRWEMNKTKKVNQFASEFQASSIRYKTVTCSLDMYMKLIGSLIKLYKITYFPLELQ